MPNQNLDTAASHDAPESQPAAASQENGKANVLSVVISTGQSRNPEKRSLESDVASLAAALPGVRVITIPHLYDCKPDGESFETLKGIGHDLVFLSWLYGRAAHWVLDRNGVRGQVGEVELVQDLDDEEEETEDEVADRVIDQQPRPARKIYSIDFRASDDANEFAAEINRIAENTVAGTPLTIEMLARAENPTNDTFLGSDQLGSASTPSASTPPAEESINVVGEHPTRRWYPVIDFSRCTNCMECIDFCLFGVYGIDSAETILVEQADNCRKGCPACSRVCPQNAIIFPQHKTPAIAGAPVDAAGMKIDLSKLFGAPESGEDAAAVAARERDEQLILAGRAAVGEAEQKSESLEARIAEKQSSSPDELDNLIDELDSLDL